MYIGKRAFVSSGDMAGELDVELKWVNVQKAPTLGMPCMILSSHESIDPYDIMRPLFIDQRGYW